METLTRILFISFTIKTFIDCLNLKKVVDDLIPREIFDGNKIIYEVEKSGRESWKVSKLTVTSRFDVVQGDCSSATFAQVIKTSSQILSLSLSFQCFVHNPETVLAILKTGAPARNIWDVGYCSNRYITLEDISLSTDNFCHLDAFSKQYNEIHLRLMNADGELKRIFKYTATYPVSDQNWFSSSHSITSLTKPSFSTNFFFIVQLETLLSDPYYLHVNSVNNLYKIRYTTGSAKTISNMMIVDFLVIMGIE
ncbi:hypothetical protein SNEBB_004855 [Seison nebaliae]|nr:hypothetical protein SNEBB_004855 [Seison nebaliae]